MSNKYKLTKEFKLDLINFLSNYLKYEEILNKLRDDTKDEYSEEDVNDILNLIGSFRLHDVYFLVERMKAEVIPSNNNK